MQKISTNITYWLQEADEKKPCVIFNLILARHKKGHAVSQLVEALRYKPGGRVFDSR
jgi:hypothetical protein